MRHNCNPLRALAVLLAMLMLGAMLSGCSDKIKPVESTEQQMKVIGTCAGYKVYYEELVFVTRTYKTSLEQKYGEGIWDDPATAAKYREELEELVFENLKANYAILKGCENLFIDTQSTEIDDYVQEQVENLVNTDEDAGGFGGDFDAYLDWLEENSLTDHYLRFVYRVNFLESRLYYALVDGGIFEYSETNYSEFLDYVLAGEHYVRTVHVYIPNETEASKEKNLKTATEIADALAACTDDDARYQLMCKYIGSEANKDLQITESGYYFTHNEMGEAYEDAAFGLNLYQSSGVVEYSGSYYVIMRLPIEELYVLMHGDELLQYYQSAQLGAYEENVKENLTMDLNEYGLSLDLTTIK